MDGGEVRCTRDGPVAHLVIDHQRRRNVIGPAVIASLTQQARKLANDPDVRVVTLSGAGPTFAAGANVKVMATLDADRARALITSLHHAIDAVRNLPVPVIAVLRGHCYGAAMELASACDMRAADTTLIAGMPEVRLGIPSVVEACLLPRLIGWGRTSELLLTGREINAADAHSIGFVERVTKPEDLDAAVNAWVDDILASAPAAVRAQKRVMRGWEADDRAGIAASIDAFAESFTTGEPQARMPK